MFDEPLVGRLGYGPNRTRLDTVLAQIREVLQHAVFAAGVGFAVEQEEQRPHAAAASM